MRIDYALTLDGDRTQTVVVESGATITIQRLRVKGFIQLKAQEKEISDALKSNDPERVEQAYRRYIFIGSNQKDFTGRDMYRLFLCIFALNVLDRSLAIIEPKPAQKKTNPEEAREPIFDYPNRAFAVWIHQLASHYHWSRDDIFNLYPDELMCYIQEIMIEDWRRQEWEWEMAGFGWTHDTEGQSHRNRFPAPAWAEEPTIIPKVKLRRSMLPLGVVEDLGGVGVNLNDENPFG